MVGVVTLFLKVGYHGGFYGFSCFKLTPASTATLSKPETVRMGGLVKARTKLLFRNTVENI